MKIKLIALLTFASALKLNALVISDFGTGQFLKDDGLTTFPTYSQTSSIVSFSGTDQQQLAGTFSAVDITSLTNIALNGSISTNPASNFTVTLYDGAFKGESYSGNWSSLTGGTVSLSWVSTDSGFNSTSVSAILISTGGAGSALSVTLDSITATSAIPEPSTYAALAGLAILGVAATRRRRSV